MEDKKVSDLSSKDYTPLNQSLFNSLANMASKIIDQSSTLDLKEDTFASPQVDSLSLQTPLAASSQKETPTADAKSQDNAPLSHDTLPQKINEFLPAKDSDESAVDLTKQFLDTLTITGVMFGDEENKDKVLINNQVYTVNSIVDDIPELGKIRLDQIKPHEIILKDESGTEYRKSL